MTRQKRALMIAPFCATQRTGLISKTSEMSLRSALVLVDEHQNEPEVSLSVSRRASSSERISS